MSPTVRSVRAGWLLCENATVHVAFGLVVLVASAVSLAALARRFGVSEPLVLTLAGMFAAFALS